MVHLPDKLKNGSVQLFVLSRKADVAGAFRASPAILKPHSEKPGEGVPFDLIVTEPSILDLEAKNAPGSVLRIEVEALEANTGISTRLPISLKIVDENDHGPVFGKEYYAFNVSGSLRPGSVIGTIHVKDADSGEFGERSLVYRLVGTHSSSFAVSKSRAGEVELVVAECEREDCTLSQHLPQAFPLILSARDNGGVGRSSAVPLTIHLRNDDTQSPVFESQLYERTITEGATEFKPVLQVKARDEDSSRIRYSVEDPSGLFGIDAGSGIVFPEYPKFLTLEAVGPLLNLTAIASDGRNVPARTVLRIRLQEAEEKRNQAPVFEQPLYTFRVQVGENFVGTVSARDPEGPVSYSIAQGGGGSFALSPSNGSLYYTGPIPLETTNFTIQLAALDGSKEGRVAKSIAKIVVDGRPSRLPSFIPGPSAAVSIRENALPGSLLYTFRVEDPDPDAYLVYKVASVRAFDRHGHETSIGGGAGPLGSQVVFGGRGFGNGSLYLAKTLPETGLLSLQVHVQVIDAAHAAETPITGYLTIAIGPLSPLERLAKQPLRFLPLKREPTIPETLPVGSFVMPSLLEERGKGGEFVFRLLSGAPHVNIDEHDGTVRVASSLDDVRVVNVTVGVNHDATGRTTTITRLLRVTPVNNHPPHFSQEGRKGSEEMGTEMGMDEGGEKLLAELRGESSPLSVLPDLCLVAKPWSPEEAAKWGVFIPAAASPLNADFSSSEVGEDEKELSTAPPWPKGSKEVLGTSLEDMPPFRVSALLHPPSPHIPMELNLRISLPSDGLTRYSAHFHTQPSNSN